MRQRYTSDELVHLVGSRHPTDDDANFETLSRLIGSGEVRTKRMESGPGAWGYLTHRNGTLADETRLDPNVTCFADIPAESLGIHVFKYGRFGIAFKRANLVQKGARPVMYVPHRRADFFDTIGGNLLLRDLDAIHESFLRLCEKRKEGIDRATRRERDIGALIDREPDVLAATRTALELYFLSFVKPFDSTLSPEDPHNFYMEREWRKLGNLEFVPDDVAAIYVADDFVVKASKRFPIFADRIRSLNGSTGPSASHFGG